MDKIVAKAVCELVGRFDAITRRTRPARRPGGPMRRRVSPSDGGAVPRFDAKTRPFEHRAEWRINRVTAWRQLMVCRHSLPATLTLSHTPRLPCRALMSAGLVPFADGYDCLSRVVCNTLLVMGRVHLAILRVA